MQASMMGDKKCEKLAAKVLGDLIGKMENMSK
jgi:hypothetical protein